MELNEEDYFKLWLQVGYTEEEANILAKDSLINTNDMANISAEDVTNYLTKLVSKYPINEVEMEYTVDRLNDVDEQQIVMYEELKEVLNNIK